MAVGRVVVVGCGSIGQRHARLLAKRADLDVELCDPNEERMSETIALVGERRTFSDYRKVLRTKPEAVVIATPHEFHAGQVIAALDSGAHVLCEKPMSDNLHDAERMADAAETAGQVLDVGFTLHFHPALARLQSLIVSGELGQIVHMHCRVGTYTTLSSSRSRHQVELEGALLLDYVHQPDILYWLSGMEPAGVCMTAAVGGDLPLRSNPNVADVLLDYDDVLHASIHLNYVQAPQRHEYEIVGDKAWGLLDLESNTLRVGRREGECETLEKFNVNRDELFEAEHQAFFDAVEGKRRPESPPGSALVSMRIVDAALRSWKQSKRVRIDVD